jgi:hypothetical protein
MYAENLPPNYPQQGVIRKRLEYEMPKRHYRRLKQASHQPTGVCRKKKVKIEKALTILIIP